MVLKQRFELGSGGIRTFAPQSLVYFPKRTRSNAITSAPSKYQPTSLLATRGRHETRDTLSETHHFAPFLIGTFPPIKKQQH